MFTGLIQSIGTIKSLGEDRFSLNIKNEDYHIIKSDLSIGDSVAVDGVCLTVEKILETGFVATASPETLNRTTLATKKDGIGYVNLETSLQLGSKIGGHFVTGHVDGIGCLVESLPSQKAWEMTFTYPTNLISQWQKYIAPFIISKGSIAVNGISLTISECDLEGNWFKVAVIPHTYQETNLAFLKSGDLVNLESDILGKYVAKLINHRLENDSPPKENISLDFLVENGYI